MKLNICFNEYLLIYCHPLSANLCSAFELNFILCEYLSTLCYRVSLIFRLTPAQRTLPAFWDRQEMEKLEWLFRIQLASQPSCWNVTNHGCGKKKISNWVKGCLQYCHVVISCMKYLHLMSHHSFSSFLLLKLNIFTSFTIFISSTL